MRKADIANEIYKQVGISKNEAADIVELVLNMHTAKSLRLELPRNVLVQADEIIE